MWKTSASGFDVPQAVVKMSMFGEQRSWWPISVLHDANECRVVGMIQEKSQN